MIDQYRIVGPIVFRLSAGLKTISKNVRNRLYAVLLRAKIADGNRLSFPSQRTIENKDYQHSMAYAITDTITIRYAIMSTEAFARRYAIMISEAITSYSAIAIWYGFNTRRD